MVYDGGWVREPGRTDVEKAKIFPLVQLVASRYTV
jgi:hypothetical protein